MFDVESLSESMTRPYIAELSHEGLLWFLGDVVEAANRSQFFDDAQILQTIGSRIKEIEDLYDGREADYYTQLEGGRPSEADQYFREILPKPTRTHLTDEGALCV